MTFEVSLRARILADLMERRRLMIETKAIKARLKQIAADKAALATRTIAERHGVAPRLVNHLANAMQWGEHEKPPQCILPAYDAYYDR